MLMKHNFNIRPQLYCVASGVVVLETPEIDQTKSECKKLLYAINGEQNIYLI